MFNQQYKLLQEGLEATAEVVDISRLNQARGMMSAVKLDLRVKQPDGSFQFAQSFSWVPISHLPIKGQLLRIKYFPDNLSSVLILNSSFT
ncbi:MAG TPA: hypothetical protein PK191_03555 [Niabella sp.]|nr:hypothetical protein [Niabella sp.]HOZ95762.1 hypothetical protein [Niabella sp.]HQW13616.1 hypothetical protein [Niabella sp.]HQX19010.1 hypothetical protein [Niabella sp.]HRB06301.1 hypothetical protein [Niabella sp.]